MTDKEYKVDQTLDITGETCPITYVKTKLRLEEMQPGQMLEVILSGGEPLQNVPRSAKNEGHKVLQLKQLGESKYKLVIQRGEG